MTRIMIFIRLVAEQYLCDVDYRLTIRQCWWVSGECHDDR